MGNSIAVGLAEIKISRNPDDVIVAFGLGSCLGIGIYDPILRLGGMLHAVLPHNNVDGSDKFSPKYVDTGIAGLLEQLQKEGLNRARMIVKMAGGANMLNIGGNSSPFDIGTRNIEIARQTFRLLNIKVSSEEVGGQTGRTVRMYIPDGKMTLRMMGGKEKEF
jgi:chemotaxis protein CheD